MAVEECIQKGVATGITQGEIIGTLKPTKNSLCFKRGNSQNIITDFLYLRKMHRIILEKYW